MKVLVVGGGGREHAIAWRLAQSEKIQQVFVAPGNAGTALERDLTNVPITQVAALRDWALANKIGLTVVGPEQPLSEGIVDDFRAHGLRIFGPTQAAAQLESSKAYSKAFMKRHGIPTANYEVFTDVQAAKAYVREQGAPIVIKADGLAAGKGVVVAQTLEQALDSVDDMLAHSDKAQGARQIVVEEFLSGEEASFIVVVDGQHVVPLATSQDHKRLNDGDLGPNTGGMGAYSPAPVVTPEVHAKAMREIILPTIKGMQKEGIAYTGFLYAGLMISSKGEVKTLEFNCRLGDPETQPLLMRLKSDFYELMMAATSNGLESHNLDWDRRAALGVVLASRGYPFAPVKGDVINGLPKAGDGEETLCKVFHAGTTLSGGQVVTDGGRVLCVTALGHSIKEARKVAYEQVDHIHFQGQQARRDIGHRAL